MYKFAFKFVLFHVHRFIIIRGLFNPEESAKMRSCVEERKKVIEERAYARKDDTGRDTRQTLEATKEAIKLLYI